MELRQNTKEKVNENIIKEKIIKEKSTKPKANIHVNHRSRLKSQFINNGITSFTDIQKLEMLLFYAIPQKDTNPLAHELLNKFGSLKDVMRADFKELMKVNGIKENSATLITFVNEFLNHCSKPSTIEYIGSTQEAKEYSAKYYFNVSVEQFYVFCLGKDNQVLRAELIKSGTADEVDVQIRRITQVALDAKCNRIVISHNHPNGIAVMSDEDLKFTYSVMCSCLLNSIDIIDHVLVGTNRAISMAEQGTLQKVKDKAYDSIKIPDDQRLIISSASAKYIICPETDYIF